MVREAADKQKEKRMWRPSTNTAEASSKQSNENDTFRVSITLSAFSNSNALLASDTHSGESTGTHILFPRAWVCAHLQGIHWCEVDKHMSGPAPPTTATFTRARL